MLFASFGFKGSHVQSETGVVTLTQNPASFEERGLRAAFLQEGLCNSLAVFVVGGNDMPPIMSFLQIHGNLRCLFAFSNHVKSKHGILFSAYGMNFYREPRIAFVHLSNLFPDYLILVDERL
jgi:hypothetical protein